MKIELGQPYSFSQMGQRENQEDARYPDKDIPDSYQPYFMVCDGVGGNNKGEVASRTACDSISYALAGIDWSDIFTVRHFEEALRYAYRTLASIATTDNEGMATTLTFLAFHRDGCFAAHIGDSRIYQIRPGYGIMYRSADHSLVKELVHSGFITPEQAKDHPRSNVITRAMGIADMSSEKSQATTVQLTDIQGGDYFFLCSDGVLESLSEERLEAILAEPTSNEEKIRQMAEVCRQSRDNNTAYLIPVHSVMGNEIEEEQDESISEGNDTVFISSSITSLQSALDTKNPDKDVQSKLKGWFNKLF